MIASFFRLFRQKKTRVKRRFDFQGEHYNLKEIYDAVNKLYFDSKLELPIYWFGSREARPKYRIRLGVYHQRHQTIKINRVMDRPSVPYYFVSFIVYHEMLHHVVPPIKRFGRRRQIHHGEFKEREKEFREYASVKEYSKQIKDRWF